MPFTVSALSLFLSHSFAPLNIFFVSALTMAPSAASIPAVIYVAVSSRSRSSIPSMFKLTASNNFHTLSKSPSMSSAWVNHSAIFARGRPEEFESSSK